MNAVSRVNLASQESTNRVKAAIQVLLDELNNISSQGRKHVTDVILETVTREHRKLQQSFWSALLLAQIEYANASHDLRNDAAVKLAQAIKEMAEKKNFDMGLPSWPYSSRKGNCTN